MSDTKKRILETFSRVADATDERGREKLLAYGEGVCIGVDIRPKTADRQRSLQVIKRRPSRIGISILTGVAF